MGDDAIQVTTVHPGGVNTSIAKNARMSAHNTAEEVEAGQKQAAENLVMPPPKAAEIILRGVERLMRLPYAPTSQRPQRPPVDIQT